MFIFDTLWTSKRKPSGKFLVIVQSKKVVEKKGGRKEGGVETEKRSYVCVK